MTSISILLRLNSLAVGFSQRIQDASRDWALAHNLRTKVLNSEAYIPLAKANGN
jgi:hypothetical protein